MDVVESLHEDHANLAKLLDALERQLALFAEGEPLDTDIVEGILEYTLNYPDLHHHPKEDLLYERLRAVDPDAAETVGDLAAEHQDLAELARRFAAAIHNILRDLEVPRDSFEAVARRFLETYREHMVKEEQEFLPAARRSLSAADLADIDARVMQHQDPLFGAEAEERFAALRRDILHWAEDAP